MDSLSRLIRLVRPQASLELRCLLKDVFAIPHQQELQGSVPFHLLLNGSCSIDTPDGKRLELQTGDFVLFPKGGAHSVCNRSNGALPGKKITMTEGGLLPIRSNCSEAPDVDLLCGHFFFEKGPSALLFATLPDPLHISLVKDKSPAALDALVALMRDEADRQGSGALAIVTALSQALLVMALRIYGQTQVDVPNILALLSDARLSASIQALLATPGQQWTIAELGAKAAMSRATYARHFQAKAGITVAEFLMHVRMVTAIGLLQTTKRSAADIGMEVGYQSDAAFGKAFRLVTGVTPGRYRQQYQ